jgi:hypothetical protein
MLHLRAVVRCFEIFVRHTDKPLNFRHENFTGDISSRQLRDVSSNLLVMNCLVPSVLDKLVNYVVENGDHILGDSVIRLLYTCYSLGYTPTQAESFFSVTTSIILR